MNVTNYMQQELQTLKEHSNLRRLPQLTQKYLQLVYSLFVKCAK